MASSYSKRDKSHLIRILYHAVKFMNVDTLIKLAQTGKKFSKTKEIKFILNQQFRTLVVKVLFYFLIRFDVGLINNRQS